MLGTILRTVAVPLTPCYFRALDSPPSHAALCHEIIFTNYFPDFVVPHDVFVANLNVMIKELFCFVWFHKWQMLLP